MSKYQPPSVSVFPWLRANLGKDALAPLTGTDTRALRAAMEIVELYSVHSCNTMLVAFRYVVTEMQPHTRELAYHAIAHVMDWSDRPRIWNSAGLTPLLNLRRCVGEGA